MRRVEAHVAVAAQPAELQRRALGLVVPLEVRLVRLREQQVRAFRAVGVLLDQPAEAPQPAAGLCQLVP
ncbi:MAG TPA: hypothetical protein VGJ63_11360 [Micromonosporaceae bacterium]